MSKTRSEMNERIIKEIVRDFGYSEKFVRAMVESNDDDDEREEEEE